MKRSNFYGCFLWSVAVGVLVVVAAPSLLRMIYEKQRKPSCISNVKQLSLGLMMYAQDYDDRFPPTAGWSAHLWPYVKVESAFHCPSLGMRGYGYAFDRRLDRISLEKLTAPSETAALYETTDWAKDATWPGTRFATRHSDRGCVAFADGHVKALKSDAFDALRPPPTTEPPRAGSRRRR